MGTVTRLSKSIFNISNKLAKQHAKKIKTTIKHPEPIAEKNLYTILGFESREDFDKKINQFVNRETWQLLVNIFEKEVGYVATEGVVKNIICNIAKSDRGNSFIKTERTMLNEKQGSKKREKAIETAIGILKEMHSQKALEELFIIKKQAEDFLQSDFYQAQSKPLEGFAPSGAQLFAETLKYIGSLEKLSEVKKDELVENFLLNYAKPLNKKYPNSQGKREDAIKILSSDKLRKTYDNGVENGILQPMASHKECKDQRDKIDQIKNKFKSIAERKDSKQEVCHKQPSISSNEEHCENQENQNREIARDIETIDNLIKIVASLANEAGKIGEYKEVICICLDKPTYRIPERGVYQKEARRYQKMLDKDFNPVHESLKNLSEESKNLPDIKEFEQVINKLHKEHDIPQAKTQIDAELKLALNCLANTQNKLYIQLESPSTALRASHVNTKTEVIRL